MVTEGNNKCAGEDKYRTVGAWVVIIIRPNGKGEAAMTKLGLRGR